MKRICTLALCRYLLPGLDSYSQSAVLYQIARGQARQLLKEAHSAAQDVSNCLMILRHLLQRASWPVRPISWEAAWHLSERARIPGVMPFGKHKGAPITDVPADYKRWLLGQQEVDPYLVKALRGEEA